MTKPLIGITSFSLDVPCSRSVVNQQYVNAILVAGGTPCAIPVGLDEESIDRIAESIDGLLLPGGDDVSPERFGELPHSMLGDVDELRDAVELPLTARALSRNLPVLGICRGIQVMAVAAGGTLYQDIPTQLQSPVRHEVREFGRDHLAHTFRLEPGSLIATALGCTESSVNSFHHQAVRDIPRGFIATGWAPDGLIEAIEAPRLRFALGIQCHPEELWATTAPEFTRLFSAFVDAARQYATGLQLTG